MNIFVLDTDPKKAAIYHCNKHVVKMCTETAQILSSAIFLNWHEYPELPLKTRKAIFYDTHHDLYKPCYLHHPCVQWASKSKSNFLWTASLGLFLCAEYHFRYGKTIKSSRVINESFQYVSLIETNEQTQFALAMPEQYKNHNNPVESYRNYYLNEKSHLLSYKKREIPEWILKNDC